MSTFRMFRHGGPNAADVAMRQNLFTIVGAITVAAGHIEAEMKRVIILAEDNPEATFVDVDLTWSGLEKRLAAVAAGDGPLAGPVREALKWAEKKRIKATRDDAVHAAWRLYDTGHVSRSRFKHKQDGYTLMGTLEDIASHVPKMFEYASRLAGIGTWPTAVLPPLPDLEPAPLIRLDWTELSPPGEPDNEC